MVEKSTPALKRAVRLILDPAMEIRHVVHWLSEGQSHGIPLVRRSHTARTHPVLGLKLEAGVTVVGEPRAAGVGL